MWSYFWVILRARIDVLQLGYIIEFLHETDERYDLSIVADILPMLEIRQKRGIDMDQDDSTDDKKPKKKRVSNKVYYVIYIFILTLIGSIVFFLYWLPKQNERQAHIKIPGTPPVFSRIFSQRTHSHLFDALFGWKIILNVYFSDQFSAERRLTQYDARVQPFSL